MVNKRGGYQVGARRRTQILEIAERLVLANGHKAMTVKQIATEIGVSEPAVYHHFASKDVLLVELLRFRDEKAPEHNIADAVESLVIALRRNQSVPTAMELYVDFSSKAADPDHPAHEYFRERYVRIADFLTDHLLQQHRELPLPVREAARILMTLADGLQAQWLVNRDFDIAEPLIALNATWIAAVKQVPQEV